MKRLTQAILTFLFLVALYGGSLYLVQKPAAGSTEVVDSVRSLVFFQKEAEFKDGFFAIVARCPKKETDTFYERQLKGFAESVETSGYTAEVYYPNDASAESQAAIVDDLLEKGIDGICIDALDESQLTDVLDKASLIDIPVIFMDYTMAGGWSQAYVSPLDFNQETYYLLESIYTQAGRQGQFAIICPSGQESKWERGFKTLMSARSRYRGLDFLGCFGCDETETAYDETVSQLLDSYPELKIICTTSFQGTVYTAGLLTAKVSQTKAVGIGLPQELAAFIGDGPLFSSGAILSWRAKAYGSLCGYYLLAAYEDSINSDSDIFSCPLGEYSIKEDQNGVNYIVLRSPFVYNSQNIENWKTSY